MSSKKIFPIEHISHIDMDYFKRQMPEWKEYLKIDKDVAAHKCHEESAFMAELAQEIALQNRQDIWFDCTLSNGEKFLKWFENIRF